MHYVYGLFDPLTGKLRYIGCTTKSIKERLNHHLRDKQKNQHKVRWIAKLKRAGLKPIAKQIDICDTIEEMKRSEIWWINYFTKKKCDLTNKTRGGDGVWGYKFSDEQKKMISERTKLAMKNLSPEIKEKMRNTNKGKPAHNRRKLIDHLGNTYTSLTEAANILDVHESAIRYGLKNYRQVKNYSFKYYENGDVRCRIYENRNSKPIRCIELNKEYMSVRNAARELKLDPGDIGKVCKGTRPHCGGYTFTFINQ